MWFNKLNDIVRMCLIQSYSFEFIRRFETISILFASIDKCYHIECSKFDNLIRNINPDWFNSAVIDLKSIVNSFMLTSITSMMLFQGSFWTLWKEVKWGFGCFYCNSCRPLKQIGGILNIDDPGFCRIIEGYSAKQTDWDLKINSWICDWWPRYVRMSGVTNKWNSGFYLPVWAPQHAAPCDCNEILSDL